MKKKLRLAVALLLIALYASIFFYPAFVILRVLTDGQLRRTGQCSLVAGWFEAAARRYERWGEKFLETQVAAALDPNDVAGTEWPIFGSVFLLVTAQDLQREGVIDATRGQLRAAVETAGRIVASPDTATWVKKKWGAGYLERENVFYRMLLILGLAAHEEITGEPAYHMLMAEQRDSLAAELAAAPHHLLDDYPGECYPNDLLWAVAAIRRAAALGADPERHRPLAAALMAAFDMAPVRDVMGLPAFQMSSRTGAIQQDSRGSGNSGILLFAAELDPVIAARWYRSYEKNFWSASPWLCGFREMPRGEPDDFMDVDSGPVLFGRGSVASAFGIGAARTVGRLDHAVPLTLEAVACCWPTPFGFLIPGAMGKVAVESWSLGEVALLFSMTRPMQVADTTPWTGAVPGIVWLMLVFYLGTGTLLITLEVRMLRRKGSEDN